MSVHLFCFMWGCRLLTRVSVYLFKVRNPGNVLDKWKSRYCWIDVESGVKLETIYRYTITWFAGLFWNHTSWVPNQGGSNVAMSNLTKASEHTGGAIFVQSAYKWSSLWNLCKYEWRGGHQLMTEHWRFKTMGHHLGPTGKYKTQGI